MKDKLKAFWSAFRPRNWSQFALGMVCMGMGGLNVYYDAWYSKPIGIFALVMAGFSISGSIIFPQFKEMAEHFNELSERFNALDPKAAAHKAAEEFKEDILARQARGEFGENIQIVFSEVAPPEMRPPTGRLN